MKLSTLFDICRALSYIPKAICGAAVLALMMFDPDRSVQEYVPTVYAILFGTIVITSVIIWVLHDITRVTRYIEPVAVCLLVGLAELYGLVFKKVPNARLLKNAYSIYARCGYSLYQTFVTCRRIYDQYAREALKKTKKQWRDNVEVHFE